MFPETLPRNLRYAMTVGHRSWDGRGGIVSLLFSNGSQPASQTDTVNSEINKKLLQNDLIVIIITMSEKKQKQQQFVCFYSAAGGRT